MNDLLATAFITDVVEFEVPMPFALAPGIEIRKASSEQIELIKDRMQKILGTFYGDFESFYQADRLPSGGTSNAYTEISLPPQKWRYFTLSTDGNDGKRTDLQRAIHVSQTPFDIKSVVLFENGGYLHSIGQLQWRYCMPPPMEPQRIDIKALTDIQNAYAAYLNVIGPNREAPKYPEIERAHQLLEGLLALPPNSEFQVLGLFAIIEMLITHNPKLEDRGDSITHQMQSKLPLLSNRFASPISEDEWFSGVPKKKVWSALYAYRSAIAHGGTADFGSGDLARLKSRTMALSFLDTVVRKLIRHAYTEPQLFRDLREC